MTDIQKTINAHPVVLFMKGNELQPMCGFSATIVQILNHLGVEFQAINVLENEETRTNVKEFSNWPTIPQLYVKGEFLGGCDIVREMFNNGELLTHLQEKQVLNA